MLKRFISCLAILFIVLTHCFVCAAVDQTKPEKLMSPLRDKLNEIDETNTMDVGVWFKDIDYQELFDTVEEDTGLTVADLDMSIKMPSQSVLNDIESLSEHKEKAIFDNISNEMHYYLKETRDERQKEAALCEQYAKAVCSTAKEMYIEQNAKMIVRTNINMNNIIFVSSLSPMVIVRLKKDEISKLTKYDCVSSVYYVETNSDWEECSYQSAQRASNIDKVKSIGLTGDGVKVGMIETGWPEAQYDSFYTKIGSNIERRDHANNALRILSVDSQSIAPNADIYCTNGTENNVEALVQAGVSIINVSWGSSDNPSPDYSNEDKWFDHLANLYSITMICSAGNYSDRNVLTPAKGYNTIAVGAFDDKGTINEGDDQLKQGTGGSGSSYLSYNEKPDILASSNLGSGGTSSSAPVVTGALALLLELKPSLRFHPEVIKAVVLASAKRKVISSPQESMSDGLTNMQGAGVFDAYIALAIVGKHQYCQRIMNNGLSTDDIYFHIPSYGSSNIKFSLSWRIPTSSYTSATPANLDLYAYDCGGSTPQLLGSSSKANSSVEIVHLSTQNSTGKYHLFIDGATANASNIPYAIAWSKGDDMYRLYPEVQGLYYIRNKNTGKHLIDQNGSAVLNSTTSNPWQLWVVQESNSSGKYNIRKNQGGLHYLDVGALSDIPNNYYASVDQTKKDIRLSSNSDGSFSLFSIKRNYEVAMNADQSSISSFFPVIWSTDYSSGVQHWIFEMAYYKYGDVNMDGVISATDHTLLQQYVASSVSLSPAQVLLADIDLDGSVTLQDALYLDYALSNNSSYIL